MVGPTKVRYGMKLYFKCKTLFFSFFHVFHFSFEVYGFLYEQGRRYASSNNEYHEVSNGIFDGMKKHRQIAYAIITPSPSYWLFLVE
jgi:hypothetical protein